MKGFWSKFISRFEIVRWREFQRSLFEFVESHHEEDDPWSAKMHLPEVFEALDELLGTRRFAKALDVGAGSGEWFDFLKSRCDEIWMLELSKKAIAKIEDRVAIFQARDAENAKVEVHILARDVHQFSFDEGVFDLLVCSFIFDYLGFDKFPQRFVSLAYRMAMSLRQGGSIVVVHPLYTEASSERLKAMLKVFSYSGCEISQSRLINVVKLQILIVVLTKASKR